MEEKTKSLYVDSSECSDLINVDDFVVTIGAKKSNSVYHVAEVRYRFFPEKGIVRSYLKVYVSDLPTALQREPEQKLIPMTWYKRVKRKNVN